MKTFEVMIAVIMILTLGAHSALAGGDAVAGETKAANCAGCHGAKGEGMGDNPAIAGMDEMALVKVLLAFKSGERENAMMQMFAGQLSEQDMADLAAYYAGLGGE